MQDGMTSHDEIHFVPVVPPVALDDGKAFSGQPFRSQAFTCSPCADVVCHRAGFLFNLLHSYNMKKEHKVFKLRGKVQHYAWGGPAFIPELLGIDNADHRPFAEYWMGAHD